MPSNDAASARLVTTARAPDARRCAAVSSTYRGRSLVRRRRIDRRRNRKPRDRRAEEGGGGTARRRAARADQVAAPQAGGAQRAGGSPRGLLRVGVRPSPIDVASGRNSSPRRRPAPRASALGQTSAMRPSGVRPVSTRRVTCPRPARRYGSPGTSFNGMEISNRSSSSAITSRIWSESNPRSANLRFAVRAMVGWGGGSHF